VVFEYFQTALRSRGPHSYFMSQNCLALRKLLRRADPGLGALRADTGSSSAIDDPTIFFGVLVALGSHLVGEVSGSPSERVNATHPVGTIGPAVTVEIQ
jgi:hypothetical protein